MEPTLGFRDYVTPQRLFHRRVGAIQVTLGVDRHHELVSFGLFTNEVDRIDRLVTPYPHTVEPDQGNFPNHRLAETAVVHMFRVGAGPLLPQKPIGRDLVLVGAVSPGCTKSRHDR